MVSENRSSWWRSPFWRLNLFLLVASLVTAIGAVVGLVAAFAWLAMEHSSLTDFARLPSNAKFLVVAAIMIGAYTPLILLTLAFLRSVDRGSPADVGLHSQRWWVGLGWGLVVGIGFVAVMYGVYAAVGFVRFTAATPIRWTQWLVFSLALCPLIGLAEELVFRGYLLKVAEEWRGRWFAVAFTSGLFWLLHLGQGNAHEATGIIGYLAIGVAFALARYGTGGLWFPIGFHTSYNWCAITFGGDIGGIGLPSLARYEVHAPTWLVGPPGHAGWLDVAFYVGLAVGFAITWGLKGSKWGDTFTPPPSVFTPEESQQ